MSTGEQEFSDAPFSEEQHWFEVVFFITFTILIVVVMMAILNALAIVDIQEMMKEAEVPMLEKLLEKVLFWDNLLHSFGNCSKLNIRLFGSGINNKEHKLELYPFKNKSGFIGFIKKNIEWFANLFLCTYIVIDDECIHGRGANNGALQILSYQEEKQKISKKEDEEEKRKKVDDVQLKQNHVDLKDQMKQNHNDHADLKDQMVKMNDVEMKDIKVEMKDVKNQMTKMFKLLLKQNHVDRKDQMKDMKDQMKPHHDDHADLKDQMIKMNYVEMKEIKDQINQMNGEMKQIKQMNDEMKDQMTKILNLLITKPENPASSEQEPAGPQTIPPSGET